MWPPCSHGTATLSRLHRHLQTRGFVSKADGLLHASTAVAKKLEKTSIGRRFNARKNPGLLKPIENNRVNLVSQDLCDDIIKYIGPSLKRHKGCDLIDLNPGVGLWSSALHSAVKPRRHIMMDLDAGIYKPFLKDLLKKKGVTMIPNSGFVWKHLFEMMGTHLAHQEEVPKTDEPKRNDTLLVTANLSMFPQKPYLGFDSLSRMVIYQFISSIRMSTLFQKYGLVRMLVWVDDEDKLKLIPKSIQRRRRDSFYAEMSCDWIHEVAGVDLETHNRYQLRDECMNLESGYKVLERMQKAGLSMPTGRETRMYQECLAKPELIGERIVGVRAPVFARPFLSEKAELEEEFTPEEGERATGRLRQLRYRTNAMQKDSALQLELLQERDEILRAYATSPSTFPELNSAWDERIEGLKKNPKNEFNMYKDSYHLFRQDPPVMLWDRREYEPLAIQADEFFPNVPSALLDIQPKAMHPVLRQYGPDSTRSGDISETMLRFWYNHTLYPVGQAMESLWPGFGESFDQCPSLLQIDKGGSPMTGNGALTARSVNEQQWIELLEAWMRWPFRPTYSQMLGRLHDDDPGEEDEGAAGVMGAGT